jgi:hypothetical protein
MVNEHVEKLNINVEMVTPAHVDRSASPEFRHSVKRLKDDGHYKCWICGTTEDLQVHHFGCEWSESNDCDMDELGQVLLALDVYGYNHADNSPIETVDDVRCMMVLCQTHHTGVDHVTKTGTGIHNTPFPFWLMQRVGKVNPLPQKNESIDEVEKRVDLSGR